VHVAANETASLQPAHTYVPWVVVEGVAIGSAHPFLRQFVCVALPGSDRPESCTIPGQAEVGSSRATLQLA
jgi:interferon gamma-inducible protein 30